MTKTKRIKVTNKGKCSVALYCKKCKRKYELHGFSSEQLDELYHRDDTGKYVQEIIPEVPAEWRGLLINHTCPDCWAKMFGEET